MQPVHHLHRLPRQVLWTDRIRRRVRPSIWDDLFPHLSYRLTELVFRQSEALEQTRQRQLGHRIVHLDEPGQQHPLLTVPLEPLYLPRRRMILHLSLLVLRHQLSLRDLVLQLPDLVLQLLDHPLLVLRRGFLRRVLAPNFHQHYLLSIPVHH